MSSFILGPQGGSWGNVRQGTESIFKEYFKNPLPEVYLLEPFWKDDRYGKYMDVHLRMNHGMVHAKKTAETKLPTAVIGLLPKMKQQATLL